MFRKSGGHTRSETRYETGMYLFLRSTATRTEVRGFKHLNRYGLTGFWSSWMFLSLSESSSVVSGSF